MLHHFTVIKPLAVIGVTHFHQNHVVSANLGEN